jgi:hypothetical protein
VYLYQKKKKKKKQQQPKKNYHVELGQFKRPNKLIKNALNWNERAERIRLLLAADAESTNVFPFFSLSFSLLVVVAAAAKAARAAGIA